ncbi:hypothetical protein M422DRAFT_259913 [Sphaerobolus stellatus SS14]|uniref:Unplaced genomic scaffold SPHSTscaffold_93, whole genome shotgun sequence n=1 Tax=Sphaerobolus stellatus (strain SS14) TaxID=990650 RepID=A0A0C9U3U0_SPHS4|nr:hypothetical protein M422DRAFT_259913 [Sphaerobolus stellatus SS14]
MMSAKPFVLVTGGTGFLGSHIVKQLLEAGYRVRCTARPLKSRFLADAYYDREGQLEVVEVQDLATDDLTSVLNGMEKEAHPGHQSFSLCILLTIQYILTSGINAVVHTAFPAPDSLESTELLSNGVRCTSHLLRQAHEQGIRKFVITSSYLAAIGGDPDNVWREYTFTDRDWSTATYDEAFDGTHDPAWVYAAAKKLAEAAAWDFARSHPEMDIASVLPTLLIGPFAPGHAIMSTGDLSTNILLHSILSFGLPPHPVWPYFVDVRDAAAAHIQALEAPPLLSSMSAVDPGSQAFQSVFDDLTALTLSAPTTPFVSSLTSPPTTPFVSSLPSPSPSSPFQKRLIVSGSSFTWAEAITHIRAIRPDLRLPDEGEYWAKRGLEWT